MIVHLDTNLAGLGNKLDVIEVEDLYGQGLVSAGFATEVTDPEGAADAVPVAPQAQLADTPATDGNTPSDPPAETAGGSDGDQAKADDGTESDAEAKVDREAAEAEAAKPAAKSGTASK